MAVTRFAGAVVLVTAALVLAGATAAPALGAPAPCLFAFSSRLPGDVHIQRLQEVGSRVSVVAPNWYTLDLGRAEVVGAPNLALRAVAAERGIELWPVLNARAGFVAVLRTAAQRRRLADVVAALAARERFAGITLDLEQIRPAERRAFTALVSSVARRLHRAGRRLAVYVPRRTAAPPTPFAAPYDWPRLARAADLVLASLYNEHHADGPPGPVTTTAGARAVLRYARTAPGWRRMAPVLGAFGYRWPASGGQATLVSSADAALLAASPGTRVATADGEATFLAAGDRVWFETAAGLVARARQVRRAGMRWLAVFTLGREPQGVMQRWGTRRRPGCRRSRPVAQR
jgi:spore germination protein YaaH